MTTQNLLIATVAVAITLFLLAACGGGGGSDGSSPPAGSLDTSLDTSFGIDGKVTTAVGDAKDLAYAIALQSDGKILVAGYSYNSANTAEFALVRYNTNGSLDTSFDVDGKVTTSIYFDAFAYAIALQSDGKIVVAGRNTVGNTNFALVRYNTNGSLDTSFDTDGKVTTPVGGGDDGATGIAIQSDGKIVVAGYSHNGTNSDFAVVRYNTNGSLDTSFGTDGKVTTPVGDDRDVATSIALQSDGKIVVAGYSYNGTFHEFALVRYNTNGSLDTSFDTDGKVTTPVGYGVTSIALQSDGKILMAGSSYNGANYDFTLVRYNTNGSLDTSFDTDGKVTTPVGGGGDNATGIALQSDGKILVAGYSYNSANIAEFALVRYNTNGSLDTSFNADGIVTTSVGAGRDVATGIALQSDGKIVVAGYSNTGDNDDFALVRYTP